MDPELSDTLNYRMTLCLMGSNIGTYVWISMGCVKKLWGMSTKAISLPAYDLYILGQFLVAASNDISQLRELLISYMMKAAVLLLESRESVLSHYQVYHFWG